MYSETFSRYCTTSGPSYSFVRNYCSTSYTEGYKNATACSHGYSYGDWDDWSDYDNWSNYSNWKDYSNTYSDWQDWYSNSSGGYQDTD